MFLSTGNRFGKSEVAAVALLLFAALNPSDEFPVLNASITMDQAQIVWKTAERFALRGNLEHWIDDVLQSPFPTIKFKHGTELWARSTQYDCKHIEGHKFAAVNADEIALMSVESVEVLRMRLIDRSGPLWGTGTPHGKNRYYREVWRPAERRRDSFTLTGSTYDNPHIPPEAIERTKATLSERAIAQKIYGEFQDDEGKPFSDDAIGACTNADLERLREERGEQRHGVCTSTTGGQEWVLGCGL